MQNNIRTNSRSTRGFTIIELLLVIIIAGAILAVVVPRAYRANVNAKYTLVRQNCTELASNANMWGQRMLTNQPVSYTASLMNYMDTLASVFIAGDTASNWHTAGAVVDPPSGTVSAKVEDLMGAAKKPRNPFNGASVFANVNNPFLFGPTPGAIACFWSTDFSVSDTNHYYALIYQGDDSTTWIDFHAGQDNSIEGLRNGVFITLLEPAPAP